MPGTAVGLAPSDPRAGRIRQSMEDHDGRAKNLQRKRVTFAWLATLVSPFAVGFLAVQVLFYRAGGGKVWIGIEVLLVVAALVISYWRMMGWPHRDWIRERVRAEILRREEFLFRARVGPYLKEPTSSLDSRVTQRLQRIDSDVREPIELVLMKEKEGDESWRDALEDARADALADALRQLGGQPSHAVKFSLPAVPDLSKSLDDYLEKRVEDQREWFSQKSDTHRKSAQYFENGAKLVLVLAVLVAVAHLVLLLAKGTESRYSEVCMFFAIWLPAIGATLVGIESLLESDRLSRSYTYHSEVLEDFKESLRRLSHPEKLSQADRQFEFMRIVLEVEDMFSSELRHWWFLMQPNVPSPRA